jgi:hypothetical protein
MVSDHPTATQPDRPVAELMRVGEVGTRDVGQSTLVLVRGRVVAHLTPSGVNHCLVEATDWEGEPTGRAVIETYTSSLRWVADHADVLYQDAALPSCLTCGEPFTEDDVTERVSWPDHDPDDGFIHMPDCVRSGMRRSDA